ncbi:MAG: hypothetical protein HDR89_04055 [Bacteroides sp.]|nr:hypothetical protein [Bacteroides sp.]MBD5350039.1 hypothetical protein [Bacteroides sp.]MDE5805929.1 hypothetical protein [Paramuribaculum sp.]
MKKLFYLLIALPLMAAAITACSDSDDDYPQVTIGFSYTGGVVSENQVYVVQPDTLYVDSIAVTAVREGHKATCVGPVNYWLDGRPVGTSFYMPFGIAIPSDALKVGSHTLTAQIGIAEEGYPLSMAVTNVRINVVSDQSEIPVPAEGTRTSMPVEFSLQ